MRRLIADVRYALRVMSRTPSFAVAVVSVLALGIGANSAKDSTGLSNIARYVITTSFGALLHK